MKLLGKRVLLSTPPKKESILELTPETERAMDDAMIKLWTKLEIYAIGTDVTLVKPLDKVYVSVSSLSLAERVDINDETKLLINEFEVVLVWETLSITNKIIQEGFYIEDNPNTEDNTGEEPDSGIVF